MQRRKSNTVEDNTKGMNTANFLIYIQVYMLVLYVARMNQNKNDSTNSILKQGRVVDNNCCVVFPTSRFP